MKRRWLVLSGIAAVLVVIVAVFVVRSRAPDAPKFETVEVRKGPLAAKVTATGTLSALVTVQVGSQVSGRLQEILVDYNSPVNKGQLIARIDPQLFTAALEQARANNAAAIGNLAKAKVDVELNRRTLERQKALAERKLISDADLDTALAVYVSSRAAV
jgi:HlyD family secretion protein